MPPHHHSRTDRERERSEDARSGGTIRRPDQRLSGVDLPLCAGSAQMANGSRLAPPVDSKESYECVNCSAKVPSLFVQYSDPGNTSLVQCAACGNLADVHLSFPFEVLALLDLVLLKEPVYRHLLRNRGGRSAHERQKHQLAQSLKLGSLVLAVDTLVRCFGTETATESEFLLLYAKTAAYCFLETLSLLLCIAVSAALVALPAARWRDLRLVPLTYFYASLPVVLFLSITSIIWRDEYLPGPDLPPTSAVLPPFLAPLTTRLDALYRSHRAGAATEQSGPALVRYAASFSRANLRSPLAEVGSARGWASEAVLRKWVGGQSALVAFSVLLRTSKTRTALVLLVAWLLHLIVLHAVDPFLS
ncbi:Arv1-like family-domain-containing protein [Rhodotorula diobovata]|uniref:Protein ARV n=1 Tax=Rhodotorula diobovata TaxID=5288 RepID=A0A5C5G0I0_9BASI|nr:Arv1-like family-domain-containing protein [Rhodotorula diobovata]